MRKERPTLQLCCTLNVKYNDLRRDNFSTFHVKLFLIKLFFASLGRNGEADARIRAILPKLTDAKVDAGVFVGSQAKQILTSEILEKEMTMDEERAWNIMKKVINEFLGSKKVGNYKAFVEELLESYSSIRCKMKHKLMNDL